MKQKRALHSEGSYKERYNMAGKIIQFPTNNSDSSKVPKEWLRANTEDPHKQEEFEGDVPILFERNFDAISDGDGEIVDFFMLLFAHYWPIPQFTTWLTWKVEAKTIPTKKLDRAKEILEKLNAVEERFIDCFLPYMNSTMNLGEKPVSYPEYLQKAKSVARAISTELSRFRKFIDSCGFSVDETTEVFKGAKYNLYLMLPRLMKVYMALRGVVTDSRSKYKTPKDFKDFSDFQVMLFEDFSKHAETLHHMLLLQIWKVMLVCGSEDPGAETRDFMMNQSICLWFEAISTTRRAQEYFSIGDNIPEALFD